MKDTFSGTVTLTYNGGYGRMWIWRDQFLKCTLGWFREWLKVARLDYEHESEILIDLLEYFEFNIQRLEEEKKKDPSVGATLTKLKKKADIVRERLEAIK